MRILEGDGEQVINEQSVHIVINPIDVQLPAEMEQWRQEFAAEQKARAELGEQHFFNGPNYALEQLVASRTPIDESPEVTLRLKHGDYYTFKTTQQLDRQFADGTTPRSRYLKDPDNVPDFIRCSFGTNVAMVTSDNVLIVQRRSAAVGTYPRTWSSSANEGMSRTLDSHGRTCPNLYDVMRRGIAEELSIDRSEYHLELLAFVEEIETWMPGCLFLATLNELTVAEWQARASRGVADAFEHDRWDFVRFEIEPVVRYLLRKDRIGEWSPVGPPLYYTALVRRYGRAVVERVTAKVLRKMVQHPLQPSDGAAQSRD